jgi:hypothetical protein
MHDGKDTLLSKIYRFKRNYLENTSTPIPHFTGVSCPAKTLLSVTASVLNGFTDHLFIKVKKKSLN